MRKEDRRIIMITSFLPSKKKSYNYSEITDTPTSLPANGGNADTLGNKYSAADLDSMPKSSEVEDYTEIEPPIMDADILGSKYTADDIDEIVNDLDTHRTNTAIHITSEEKSSWNAKGTYSKPADGIPKSDLSSDIQTSLGKADSAIQEHQDISGKADKATTLAGYGITDALSSGLKGVASGVAELDAAGKVPSSQLPSYVDDVLEYANKASFPSTGETGKIYVDTTANLTYRWSGSAYVEISPSLALGETSSTAYAGDKGKANASAISTHTSNTTVHITSAERTSWNTVTSKQNSTDNSLTTTSKTIVGAINEVKASAKSACDGIDSLNALDLDTRLNRNGYGESAGGRNLWDEKYIFDSSSNIQTANDIKVKPSVTYYNASNYTIVLYVFNSNHTAIVSAYSWTKNTTYTMPSDAVTIQFYVANYGTTYKNDIAIIEGTSGSYEPYYESNLMLTTDTNEIASLKYLGWTVPREMPIKNVGKSNGMTQMVGRVDLSTLSWSAAANGRKEAAFSGMKPLSNSSVANVYCSKYAADSYNNVSAGTNDKRVSVYSDGNYVEICDKDYTDATQFRNSLQGTYLYYQLASPVEWGEGSEVGSQTNAWKLLAQSATSDTWVTVGLSDSISNFKEVALVLAYTNQIFATTIVSTSLFATNTSNGLFASLYNGTFLNGRAKYVSNTSAQLYVENLAGMYVMLYGIK